MPTSCIVTGCTSGYKSNPGKFHFFIVPKGMADEWRRALKCDKVNTGKPVCERHFRPEDVEWRKDSVTVNGVVLGQSFSRIPRRKAQAIPSILPGTDEWNSVSTEWAQRKKLERDLFENTMSSPVLQLPPVDERLGSEILSSPHSLEIAYNIELSESAGEVCPTEASPESTSVEYSLDNATIEITAPVPPLDLGRLSAASIDLPRGWIQKFSERHQRLDFFRTKIPESDGQPMPVVVWKTIILGGDLMPEIFVLNRRLEGAIVDSLHTGPISSVEEMQTLVRRLDQLPVCPGSMILKEMNREGNDRCGTTRKDLDGNWRHSECPLFFDARSRTCPACRRAQRTLRQRIRRAKNADDDLKEALSKFPGKTHKSRDEANKQVFSSLGGSEEFGGEND